MTARSINAGVKRVAFGPATRAHAVTVAARMRREDSAGLRALGIRDPAASVLASFDRALWCESIRLHGELVALYGLCPSSDDAVGLPWLVCTPAAERLGIAAVRACRPTVDRMLEHRQALVNFAHARNKAALRWLKWLGFTLEAPLAMPATGERFHPFHAGRDIEAALSYIARTRLAIEPTVGALQ